jgi:hypothetical protein
LLLRLLRLMRLMRLHDSGRGHSLHAGVANIPRQKKAVLVENFQDFCQSGLDQIHGHAVGLHDSQENLLRCVGVKLDRVPHCNSPFPVKPARF